jgi:hypothetical protein
MAMANKLKRHSAVVAAALIPLAFVLWRLSSAEWDPAALAEIGSRYAAGILDGTPGYDGQFAYFMAMDLRPSVVGAMLDVPAFRYQRIAYPLLVRLLSLGRAAVIPWMLLSLNLVAHVVGTWAVSRILRTYSKAQTYAISYALWVGLVAAVGLDLYEPLAFALITLGWLARRQRRYLISGLCLGAAMFAKETALVFWAGFLLAEIFGGRRRKALTPLLLGGVAFALWQVWLWRIFGEIELVSGGAMATPFEWIPLMGLWRVGLASTTLLVVYLVVFGPTVVVPALWGLFYSARALLRDHGHLEAWNLFLQGLLIVFLPFSTFREPLGLLRFATGLVLCAVLFAARTDRHKVLNYSLFWCPLFLILLRQ